MKYLANGKEHTAVKNKRGHLVSEQTGEILAMNDGILSHVVVVEEEVIEEAPDSSWLVADIKQWLDDNSIDYQSYMLKADLVALANA